MSAADRVRAACLPRRGAGLLALALLALGLSAQADGLQLPPLEPDSLRWQARVQLSQRDSEAGSRVLSANLLGDYYLTGSLLGGQTRGGLRATGGLLMGSPSLSQSSAGLALGNSSLSLRQSLSIGYRQINLFSPAPPAGADPGNSMSYLGIGYTGQSLRGGWGFSADLGLIRQNTREEWRLGRSGMGPSLEDVLMDMRFRPVVQFGLNYSY
jgi:hypothetical protein